MMRGVDGYGVLAAIKDNPITESIPFIFMTANTSKKDKCMGFDLGIEDYMIKPFSDDEMLSIINSKIEKNHAQKEKIVQEKLKHIKELEDMINLISHKVRNPLCTNLGLVQLLDSTDNNNEDIRKIIGGIRLSTLKLDDFTVELSDIIIKSVLNHKNKILNDNNNGLS